eukprot:CAMPEP_0113671932 /NCGR_PEP_ID=MMETSP0038_2-20120614/5970_1 /TAXON_ID=2898 /ORGANISM="Cryptomonas paramecium" /LENGTH=90 /DNA_ID=CAMNT_0000588121 /DNA_START=231 /DNA_END=500 /DNA_ORIENTATION=+ /assembly_acc=CAM_ASM_000170
MADALQTASSGLTTAADAIDRADSTFTTPSGQPALTDWAGPTTIPPVPVAAPPTPDDLATASTLLGSSSGVTDQDYKDDVLRGVLKRHRG